MVDHQRVNHPALDTWTPKVSCILPIHNRPEFLKIALSYFFRYDYPEKELVIVDDSDESLRPLIPESSRIVYVRLKKRAFIGTMRNIACEAATGELIAHHDSDDWYSADRLKSQVETMRISGRELVGIQNARFFNVKTRQAWQYTRQSDTYVIGATMMYTKAFWERNKFRDVASGEDTQFVMGAQSKDVLPSKEGNYFIAIDHGANTDGRNGYKSEFKRVDEAAIAELLGTDGYNYQDEEPRLRIGKRVTLAALLESKTECSIMTVASMIEEANNLNLLGYQAEILAVVCRNPTLKDALLEIIDGVRVQCKVAYCEDDKPTTECRNLILAESCHNDFIFMTEQGVEVVPFSVLEMLRVMDYSGVLQCRAIDGGDEGDKELLYLSREELIKSDVRINCSYSLWSSDVAGLVKFEEDPPFNTLGTGFEDNDIQFKVTVSGFLTRYFVRMKYLHPGSRRISRCADEDWRDRQLLLVKRWRQVPIISSGPLRYL